MSPDIDTPCLHCYYLYLALDDALETESEGTSSIARALDRHQLSEECTERAN